MDSHDAAVAADVKTVLALKPFFLQHFKPWILIHIIAYLNNTITCPKRYAKNQQAKHLKHQKKKG